MNLRQRYGKDCPVITLIGSIRDKHRLDEVFELYHPEVVFHAAAHKHVPLMELSSCRGHQKQCLRHAQPA